jgi:hypothetical protein
MSMKYACFTDGAFTLVKPRHPILGLPSSVPDYQDFRNIGRWIKGILLHFPRQYVTNTEVGLVDGCLTYL